MIQVVLELASTSFNLKMNSGNVEARINTNLSDIVCESGNPSPANPAWRARCGLVRRAAQNFGLIAAAINRREIESVSFEVSSVAMG